MNELLRRVLNLPEQASTVARDVDYLHYFVISITVAGAIAVFLVCFFFVLRFRNVDGARIVTPRIVGKPRMEALVIGSILTLFVGIWVVGFRQYLRIDIPPDDGMTVYVVAKQWMWKFAYADGPSSAGILYVPVNRNIKLVMTARDVIHSFYVPAFRVKKDVVPGTYSATWFNATKTGTFPIRCAEYCGTRHSMMAGDVVVLSETDFERWQRSPDSFVASVTEASDVDEHPTYSADDRRTLASRGEKAAADHGCFRCHTTDGSPHIGPTWTGLFGSREPLRDGTSVLVDEAYLTESMMDPMAKIVAGFQPVMPGYQGQIEPGETAAIVEYIKTLTVAATRPNPLPLGGVIRP